MTEHRRSFNNPFDSKIRKGRKLMALFKVFRGVSKDLPSVIHSGYAYLTTDDGKFYIDTTDRRILINPDTSSADKIAYLRDGVMTDVGAVLDELLSDTSTAFIEIHTTSEWEAEAGRDISKRGTIYVYSDGYTMQDDTQVPRLKIGDGLAYISDLPFFDDQLRQELMDHIDNIDIHVTLAEKRAWWNKLNVDDDQQIVDGALLLNRN